MAALFTVDFRLLVNAIEQFAHVTAQTHELFPFSQAPFNNPTTIFTFLDGEDNVRDILRYT